MYKNAGDIIMGLRSKMKKYNILMKDPIAARHIPETVWYNDENFKYMLSKHASIYIKPHNGQQGNNIIRVNAVRNGQYEISDTEITKTVTRESLELALYGMMKARKRYIIQQGILLATYKNKPFDMRIVLQKPYNAWQVTLTSAKVARYQDAVVTNVSKGAKDYLLHDLLQVYDQRKNPITTMREIIDLSHRLANIINNEMPITIVGLDIALDKDNNLWFIEANLRPQCARCKLVNDKLSVAKYKEARRIISES